MNSSHFDSIAEKLTTGELLSKQDISELSSTTNLLEMSFCGRHFKKKLQEKLDQKAES